MLAMAPVAVVTALDAFFGTDKITLTLDSRAPGHRGARTYDRLHYVVKDVDRARVLVGFPSATLTSKAPASAATSAATPLIATSNRSAERGVRVAEAESTAAPGDGIGRRLIGLLPASSAAVLVTGAPSDG